MGQKMKRGPSSRRNLGEGPKTQAGTQLPSRERASHGSESCQQSYEASEDLLGLIGTQSPSPNEESVDSTLKHSEDRGELDQTEN